MRGLVLPLILATIATSAGAAAWESPAFANATQRPKRVAILPVQADMARTRLNEAVPFVKETKDLEDAMRAEAAAALTTLGYEPDLTTLAPEKLVADRELQSLVRQLEAQVGGIVDVAAGRPRDIGRGRFSVGEAVLPLAQATGAEAFLWLQSQTVVPSKGQRTLGSIFSVLGGTYAVPTNRTQLVAFLLDARTGDLASVAISTSGGAVLKEPRKVAANVVGDIFRQWPSHGEARRVSAKRLAADATAIKPEVPLEGQAVDELAIIARFEEAVARLERNASAGPLEDIVAREDFTDEGEAVAADDAPAAEPVSLFDQAPATPRAPAPAPAGVVSARLAWAKAAPAQRQIVLQMLPGTPSVTVRNGDAADVLVSVDLGEWSRLARGQEQRFDVGPGSHRILVTSPDGTELARANVLISSSTARAEVLPL